MVRFSFIRRAILAERSHAERAAIALLAAAVPTGLRMAIDGGASGVPFVTYFPAIVIAALLVEWPYAPATAILSALTANWLFVARSGTWTSDRASVIIVALFLLSCALLIATGQALRRTVRDFEALAARERHLNTELQHRVKTMLAVVQALAQQSARDASPSSSPGLSAGGWRRWPRRTTCSAPGRSKAARCPMSSRNRACRSAT